MVKGLPHRLRKHAGVLRALRGLNETARQTVMASAKKELISTMVACARAIIKRAIPLTRRQSNNVCRRETSIRKFIRPRASLEQRKTALQKGGLLGALLGPILGLLPKLFGVSGSRANNVLST